MEGENIYPKFVVHPNTNPNKFYATPILGFLVKVIMLFPVFLWLWVVSMGFGVLVFLINPFVVLFTGKYWKMAYDVTVAFSVLSTKSNLFFYGLTDKYPGFNFQTNDSFELEIAYPQTASRWFAIPLFGFLVRFILLIPYFIFANIITTAAGIGIFLGAWIDVLFRGRYPESMFEFGRDSLRLSLSQIVYFSGLTQKYPSFSISWNHKNIKIALIVLAIIYNVFSFAMGPAEDEERETNREEFNYSEGLQLD